MSENESVALGPAEKGTQTEPDSNNPRYLKAFSYFNRDGMGDALIESCKAGDLDSVKFFLSHKADIEHHRNNGFSYDRRLKTPLFYAARAGHVEVVELLLKNKASISAINCGGSAVIGIRSNAVAVLRLLLANHGAVSHTDLGEALLERCKAADTAAVSFLLEHTTPFHLTMRRETPLLIASANDDPGSVRLILESLRQNPLLDRRSLDTMTHLEFLNAAQSFGAAGYTHCADVEGFTALYYAAANGNLEIVSLITNEGFSDDRALSAALGAAVKNGHPETANHLRKYGAADDYNEPESVMSAVAQAFSDELERLLAWYR